MNMMIFNHHTIIQASLTQSEADIRRLEEELEKLRAQLRSLEDELSEQKKIIDELHTKNMELNDLAELRTHNSGLQDHLNDLMEQLQMVNFHPASLFHTSVIWSELGSGIYNVHTNCCAVNFRRLRHSK